MFAKILIVLALSTTIVLADNRHIANKCIVNGRIIYTQHPCPEGTDKKISGAFSVNETSGVRRLIAIENEAKRVAAEKAAIAAAEKAQKDKEEKLQNQLDRIERKANLAASEAAMVRSKQTQNDISRMFRGY